MDTVRSTNKRLTGWVVANPSGPVVKNPSEPLRPGATVNDDGTVTFALFAPWKKSVSVFGNFNEWNRTQYPMAVSDQGLWWATISLPQGQHHYQYVIDDNLVICDPYATRIAWEGAVGGQPHAVLNIPDHSYEWHDQGYHAPNYNEMVIYELHVGDFSPEGTFKGVIQRLDYLSELGVNAIELMPVYEFPGDHSWGYNPTFYFTPEVSYGSPDDLKELVDQAHARGIAVLLDLVLNHTGPDHPFAMLYPMDQNPWMADPSFKSNEWGMPQMDLWKDATKAFVHDVQGFWLNEYHVDGFRYDALYMIGYDGLNGSSYIAWNARQNKAHAYLIGEQIPEDPHMVAATELNGAWHKRFHDQMQATLCETEEHGRQPFDMDGLCSALGPDGYAQAEEAVKYLESHDEERVMFCGKAVGQDEFTAYGRAKLGAQLLMTAAGIPMLWMGQEFGEDSQKTLDVNKLHWEKLDSSGGRDLFNVYKSLIALHKQVPALHSNSYDVLNCDGEHHVIAYARRGEGGSVAVIVANLKNEPQTTHVPFPEPGKYHEFVFNYDQDIAGEADIEVPPSGAKIFIKVA